MRWTEDQEKAITARGGNLLLSAAAGSGKTTVLVERVLSLIREGADVDAMLVVTFSRAAAADMRAKLSEELRKNAADAAIRAQLDRVDRASVCTIHSFCAELIRDHFQEAGVDPGFRVLDEAEMARFSRRAIDKTLEEAFENPDDGLYALLYGRDAEGLAQCVMAAHAFSMERPDPDKWLDEALIEYPAGDGAPWREELLRGARRRVRDALALAECALALCREENGPSFYMERACDDADRLEPLMSMEYDALRDALSGFSFDRLPSVRGVADDPGAAMFKKLRERMKKRLKDAFSAMPDFAAGMEDIRASREALSALRRLTAQYDRNLESLKQARQALSFGDLEHRALRALENPLTAQNVRARYDYVFVDEYQDVSDVQEALLRGVGRGDNVFMVGDVKQSIYRFRQAEPGLFLEKYAAYGRGEGGSVIALKQNFRSRPSILEYVNRVFERVMTGGEAEIDYDDAARLRPGGAFEGDDPPVETHLISSDAAPEPTPDDDDVDADNDADEAELNTAEKEAAVIIERLRALHGTPFYDAKAKENRPLSWRDFVILARTRAVVVKLARMLKGAGIPCYADVAEGYWQATEVEVALALLQAVDNRRRDVELLGALRSPVFGFTDEELTRVRLYDTDGSYRDAMRKCMEAGGALSDRLRAAEETMNRLRELSVDLPLAALVDAALRETVYYAYVGAMPDGAQRQANLDRLCAVASRYEASQSGGLTGFLRYVREIRASGEDAGEAHILGEGDDVVRLMTAHKSKGLEFPVVVCADMGRKLRRGGAAADLMFHKDLGVGMTWCDEALGSRRNTPARAAIGERMRAETLNEEMRILYVLLTRAKDRLILVGTTPDARDGEEEWKLLADAAVTPETWLDVLMPVTLRERNMPVYHYDGAAIRSPALAEGGTGGARALARQWMEHPPEADDAYFREALAYRYPYADEVMLPLKLTASGLTREITGPGAPPQMVARPLFMTEGGVTAAERGTLTHALLSGLDLAAVRDRTGGELRKEIRRQADAMLADGRLYAGVAAEPVAVFLEGDMGRRLLRAERVKREWAFNLRMRADEALGSGGDAGILVQGVIDCCFIEDGQWVLLDYKTDAADDPQALAAHYAPQLTLYKKALERITATPVKEACLCALRANRIMPL